VVSNDIVPSPNFGKVSPGWSLQFQETSNKPPGVIALATNSSEMMDYLNPNGKIAWYYSPFSCMDEPVTSCVKATTDRRLTNNTIQCLAVTNPNKDIITYELDVNFNVQTTNFTDPIITEPDMTIKSQNSIATTNIPSIYFTSILWILIFLWSITIL